MVFAALVSAASGEAATLAITPGHLPYPNGGTSVIGRGVDGANQNAQLAESLPATIKAGWSAHAPLCPQAGGELPASISVAGARTVVLEDEYGCSWLSAYATATGALLWRHLYPTPQLKSAKVVGSLVYIEHDLMLDALDLGTGSLKWTAYDGDDYAVQVNSIGSGIIVNELWADDALTGRHLFTASLLPYASTGGVAFVAGGRMFYNSGNAVQAYNVSTGALLWSYRKSGAVNAPGFGNAAPALHSGLLYIAPNAIGNGATTLVLNPSTGAVVRTLPGSDQPISFDGATGVFTQTPLNSSTIVFAVGLATGHRYWSHTLPRVVVDQFGTTLPTVLVTPPLIENGLVWFVDDPAASAGHVVALDEVTGATRRIITEACPAAGGMIAIAQHRIFAPSGCGIQTYTAP